MSDTITTPDTTDPALSRARRAAAIVDAALAVPHAERDVLIAQRCNGDPLLRQAVLRWLDAADAAEQHDAPHALVGPALEALRHERDADTTLSGSRLGAWRLGERLGDGGMGVVYAAERADGAFEKQVAVKIVRSALRSPSLLAQFAQERTLLARLDHPGVARLLDAGVSDSGVPYLVMERVDGVPITTWCDTQRASVRERVRLLCTACEAVQAAHRLLIVHCDLKPGHLLVTDDGAIKLLDFGIAHTMRSADPNTPAHTDGTPYRAFTPAYASPEQRRGEAATTASDVYALGAVLHRLLTGVTPPPEPSDAPSRPSSLATAKAAAVCGLTLPQLQRTLRGDLDAILQRSLAASPAERYPTVESLQQDLHAWLAHRVVRARPVPTLGRVTRFARRHPLGVSLGTVALLAIGAGFAMAARQTVRAAREAALATEINDVLLPLLAAPYPFDSTGPGPRSLRGLLDAARDRTTPLADRTDPRISNLRLSLASGYAGLGDVEQAAQLAAEVLAVRVRADGPLARTTLAARMSLALYAGGTGQLGVTLGQYDTALVIQRARTDVTPGTLAVLLQARARALFAQGQAEAAERDERAVIALFDSLGDRHNVPYAHAWQVLGQIQKSQGRLVEAEASLRRSLAVREAMRGNAVEIANVEGDIGKVRLAMGDHAGAAALLARSRARKVEVLGALDPEVADDDVALAMVALADGRLAEARAAATTAAATYDALTVPVTRAVQAIMLLTEIAIAAGEPKEAQRFIDDAHRRLDAAGGGNARTRTALDSLRARIPAP